MTVFWYGNISERSPREPPEKHGWAVCRGYRSGKMGARPGERPAHYSSYVDSEGEFHSSPDPAVEPVSRVGVWGRGACNLMNDHALFKYFCWEGYHWIELNE